MPSIPETPEDIRLLLNALPGIGPVTARRLREAFGGDLSAALRASRAELLAVKGVGPTTADALLNREFDPAAERAAAARLGLRILTELDPGWPEALAPMWDPPLALYAEGDPAGLNRPKMMSIGMHCRLLGRPGRITALQRFLDHIQSHDQVWVARRLDIARHWRQTHPLVA